MKSDSSVFLIVLDDEGALLLCRREDFRIWSLPGGRIDAGETIEGAAVREAREETGYEVALLRPVGRYEMPRILDPGHVVHVWVGRVVGGNPIVRGPETLGVAWFPLQALPRILFPPFARDYVRDAVLGHETVVRRRMRMAAPKALAVRGLIGLRDLRNWLTGTP